MLPDTRLASVFGVSRVPWIGMVTFPVLPPEVSSIDVIPRPAASRSG